MHRHPLRQVLRLPQAALKRLVTGLLQLVLLANRPARLARSGFVLPTTVLLVLMVVLTATALTYRSFTRSDMAISQREQQVIANAATPAIDRAKAKIEFIFNKDTRYTSGLPTSDFLASMMLDVPYETGIATLPNDPFTLPGEIRLDINGDDNPDNAWSFLSDANGERIVYSILVDDQATRLNRKDESANSKKITDPVNQDKALALVTRTGPLATTQALSTCTNARSESGWQVVNKGSSSTLQKNFQINVFVPNANNANRTVEAFEFQQSRIASRGNKWAAWFRYDMEIYPGSDFTINGAMHTDGSLMAGNVDDKGTFASYKVSSHNSCVYSKLASEVTVGAKSTDGSFEGQVVKGQISTNAYGGNAVNFHVWDTDERIPFTDRTLEDTNDSVRGDGTPSDVSVNPLVLYTEDKLQHNDASTWNRDAAWNNNAIFTGERVFNKKVIKPFVDDFFRADNRWGPKPRYSDTDPALDITKNAFKLGDTIPSGNDIRDPIKGLDGYWERQAIKYGLRLVVGERLELGNPREWNFNPVTNAKGPDRLYPPNATPAVPANGSTIGPNEYRQKRALRDNLAAVQGMVVYHHEDRDGAFPAACVATTAHPGTTQSIIDSRTFGNYPNTTAVLRTDFLKGVGTNGWEFEFPDNETTGFDTPDKFAARIADGEPLGIALRNLARFTGDPEGGSPSFAPPIDTDVHPAPYLTMWGDFSPLRRILVVYDAASGSATDKYAALSPADKATLHSAACTISMLAYNLKADYDDVQSSLNNGLSSFQSAATALGNDMEDIVQYFNGELKGGNITKVEKLLTAIGKPKTWTDTVLTVVPAAAIPTGSTNPCPAGTDVIGANEFDSKCDVGEYFDSYTLDDWVNLLRQSISGNEANREATIASIKNFANLINYTNSILRDRDLGFRDGVAQVKLSPPSANNNVTWDPGSGFTEPIGPGTDKANKDTTKKYVYKTSCSPNLFTQVIAKGNGGKDDQVALTLIACSNSDVLKVRYPSLYYLFPVVNHDHNGTGYHQQPDGDKYSGQPSELYITDNYAKTVNPDLDASAPPASYTYRIVGTNNVTGINAIAAVPKKTDLSDWKLPRGTAAPGSLTAPETQPFAIQVGANVVNVPFLDKGIFDGREQMAIRALDIDLKRLIDNKNVNDYWLSNVACTDTQDCDVFTEGIVYAFREDAVREDEIVRPKKSGQAVSGCLTVANIVSANCRMVTTPGSEQDPPLTDDLISLKPVDFHADPDRRPFGFRLRNGTNMSSIAGVATPRAVGMTFVTDNSVYIQGNFNLHSTDGTVDNIIEEFNSKVGGVAWTPTNFYTNRTAAGPGANDGLNANFAKPATDTWRPVEILSDAFTILSAGFLDGAAEDTFTQARPTADPVATSTSYMNQSRLNAVQTNIVRSNGANTPVWIDRNGNAFNGPSAVNTIAAADWTGLKDDNDTRRLNGRLVNAPAYVNAVFIGGIVPKRVEQAYGGLQNFPRLTEVWSWKTSFQPLQMAGAFLQLNFSTTATAPFEHDAWEPGADPGTAENNGYYNAPTRRWGYDPALLYYPPAAAARRFVSIDTPRSEYYRELPADDPYITNLRCARPGANAGTNFVFDANIRGACPAPVPS